MRKTILILLLGALVLTLATTSGGATPGPHSRATTIVSPDGSTYYVFAYGAGPGPFADPHSHGIAIYRETNEVTGAQCPQWLEGLPLGHAYEIVPPPPETYSGLQTVDNTCDVPADTKIFDTADQ